MNEPRDSKAVRLAVAGLGLATAIVLIGICLILAFGSSEVTREVHVAAAHGARHARSIHSTHTIPLEVPAVLWAFAAALVGALVGLLLPDPSSNAPVPAWIAIAMLAVVILVVFAAGGVSGSPELEALVAASGAALVAILAPSPAAPQFDD